MVVWDFKLFQGILRAWHYIWTLFYCREDTPFSVAQSAAFWYSHLHETSWYSCAVSFCWPAMNCHAFAQDADTFCLVPFSHSQTCPAPSILQCFSLSEECLGLLSWRAIKNNIQSILVWGKMQKILYATMLVMMQLTWKVHITYPYSVSSEFFQRPHVGTEEQFDGC